MHFNRLCFPYKVHDLCLKQPSEELSNYWNCLNCELSMTEWQKSKLCAVPKWKWPSDKGKIPRHGNQRTHHLQQFRLYVGVSNHNLNEIRIWATNNLVYKDMFTSFTVISIKRKGNNDYSAKSSLTICNSKQLSYIQIKTRQFAANFCILIS